MKDIVSGRHAVSAVEFAELALGVDEELFAGPSGGESVMERAARLDVAMAVLADLRREDPELAGYAAGLLHGDRIVVLWPPLGRAEARSAVAA